MLILDVGCGNNPKGNINIDLFMNKNLHRKGEINPHKIKNFINASGEYLPFRDNSIDVIKSYHVIEHIKNPILFVSELKRVSRKYIYIRTPSPFILDNATTHIFTWTKFSIKNLFKLYFENVNAFYIKSIIPEKGKINKYLPWMGGILIRLGLYRELIVYVVIKD